MRWECSVLWLVVAVCLSGKAAIAEETKLDRLNNENYAGESLQYKVRTGVDYTQGYYGESIKNEFLYMPVTITAESENYTFDLTVPYLVNRGPVVFVDQNNLLLEPQIRKGTVSGLGDIVGSVFHTYFWEDDLYLSSYGTVKIPTASEKKGLGTGSLDFTVNADVTWQMENSYIFAGAGYDFFGDNLGFSLDSGATLDFGAGTNITDELSAGFQTDITLSPSRDESQLFASAFLYYEADEETDITLSYDWQQATADLDSYKQVSLVYEKDITETVKIGVYGLAGFTSSSPDSGGGIFAEKKF